MFPVAATRLVSYGPDDIDDEDEGPEEERKDDEPEPKPSKSDDESPDRPEVIYLSATANGSQFHGFKREEILYASVQFSV